MNVLSIKSIRYFLLVSLFGCYFTSALAEENKSQPMDFIDLAATMLKDGHHDRALMALQNVDLQDEKTDFARFYTLQGLAYLSLNDAVAARDSLQLAIQNGQQDIVIYAYLAQAYFALKDYSNAVQSIEKAGDHAQTAPMISLTAQSYWHLEDTDKAIATLNLGQQKFPTDFRFLKRKVFYFVQLELYQEAAKLGRQYLELSQASAEDYIAIGNALRLSNQYTEALNILEIARLQFPENNTVAKLLAHTYLDQGQLNSAAFILEQAAIQNIDLLSEAAEIYRRAGRFHKALTLNEGIQDQETKLKQRLSILLALKQYERAANMESSLYRTGLLEDQHIRYALAYAYFSSGRFTDAKKHLDHLKEAELFRRGIELRRLMTICETEPWQCTS